jgi:hypothetical protein
MITLPRTSLYQSIKVWDNTVEIYSSPPLSNPQNSSGVFHPFESHQKEGWMTVEGEQEHQKQ